MGQLLTPGSLALLVLQPSPFCNLACRYCYLPERSNTQRLPLALLDTVLAKVMASGLLGPELSIVWHAGEPMALPIAWYEEAFAIAARQAAAAPQPPRLTHHFQTNGVLIDNAWCGFFRRHGVRVGVSIDGPAPLHDAQRLSRDGRGTHARVMAGIAQLRAAGLPFHTIAVLTRQSLAQADAIYDFFAGLGCEQVGFNVEEVELDHTQSSLQAADAEALLRRFWARLLARLQAEPGRLRVRELESVLTALRHPHFGQASGNAQNQPGQMLNVAYNGDWCFWSPELLGGRHPQRGAAVMGNLGRSALPRVLPQAQAPAPAWAQVAQAQADNAAPPPLEPPPAWAAWQQEIDIGVSRCRSSCRYFDFCLGGAPANKLAELGGFAGTETLACRLGQQVVIDAVLQALDQQLAPLPATPRW